LVVDALDDARGQHDLLAEDPRPGVDDEERRAHLVRRVVDLSDRAVGRLDSVADDVPRRFAGGDRVLAIRPHVGAHGHGSSFVRLQVTKCGYPGLQRANRYPRRDPGAVKTILNVIWLVLAGFW